jgi:enoyl-CoA hydratase/carnithine racemase
LPELISRRDGAVGTVLFSNPAKLNAMSFDMWHAVPEAIGAFERDPAIRAIVVAGDGDKAFISGADISQFETLRGTAEAQAEYARVVESASLAVKQCSKPVIARIRGICIGGGLGFAASCDVRICSDDAVFRMPAARLGLGYAPGGVRTLMNVVGASNAADLFYSARKFGAAEALRMGYVSQVHPAAQLEQAVDDYAKTVAENAPLTMAAAKFAIRQWLADPEQRDLDAADAMSRTCFASDDHKEGRKAFMEKRTPQFRGA